MFVLPKFMQDQSDSPYSALRLDDSDGQSSESQTSEIEFYADSDHLPIFKSGLQCGLSTSEIVNAIKVWILTTSVLPKWCLLLLATTLLL